MLQIGRGLKGTFQVKGMFPFFHILGKNMPS